MLLKTANTREVKHVNSLDLHNAVCCYVNINGYACSRSSSLTTMVTTMQLQIIYI